MAIFRLDPTCGSLLRRARDWLLSRWDAPVLKRGIIGLLLMAAASGASAAGVRLSPALQGASVGQTVKVDIVIDFSDEPTVGGGIDIVYDPRVLRYESFAFGPTFADNPEYRKLPQVSSGRLSALAFGSFEGIRGPTVVGTLTFTVLSLGDTGDTDIAVEANAQPSGGFHVLATFAPQDVLFAPASLNLAPAP